MEILKRLKEGGIAKRQVEEELYNRVAQELAQGERREGLWAKALADSEGIETKAQGLYIKYRVQSLVDELELQAAQEEKPKEPEAPPLDMYDWLGYILTFILVLVIIPSVIILLVDFIES